MAPKNKKSAVKKKNEKKNREKAAQAAKEALEHKNKAHTGKETEIKAGKAEDLLSKEEKQKEKQRLKEKKEKEKREQKQEKKREKIQELKDKKKAAERADRNKKPIIPPKKTGEKQKKNEKLKNGDTKGEKPQKPETPKKTGKKKEPYKTKKKPAADNIAGQATDPVAETKEPEPSVQGLAPTVKTEEPEPKEQPAEKRVISDIKTEIAVEETKSPSVGNNAPVDTVGDDNHGVPETVNDEIPIVAEDETDETIGNEAPVVPNEEFAVAGDDDHGVPETVNDEIPIVAEDETEETVGNDAPVVPNEEFSVAGDDDHSVPEAVSDEIPVDPETEQSAADEIKHLGKEYKFESLPASVEELIAGLVTAKEGNTAEPAGNESQDNPATDRGMEDENAPVQYEFASVPERYHELIAWLENGAIEKQNEEQLPEPSEQPSAALVGDDDHGVPEIVSDETTVVADKKIDESAGNAAPVDTVGQGIPNLGFGSSALVAESSESEHIPEEIDDEPSAALVGDDDHGVPESVSDETPVSPDEETNKPSANETKESADERPTVPNKTKILNPSAFTPKIKKTAKEINETLKMAVALSLNKLISLKNKARELPKRTKIIIISMAAVIMVCVLIIAVIYANRYEVPAQAIPVYMGRDEYSQNIRDIDIELDDQLARVEKTQAKGDTKEFKFFAEKEITIQEWYDNINFTLANLSTNECSFLITILDSDGKSVFRSLGLKPGKFLPNAQLNRPFPYGTHDFKIIVAAYDSVTYENIGVQYTDFKLVIGIEQPAQQTTQGQEETGQG